MTRIIGLTPRQQQAYDFIASSLRAGHSPTFEEIARHIGIKAKSGAHRYVDALVMRGLISRGGRHEHRGLSLLLGFQPGQIIVCKFTNRKWAYCGPLPGDNIAVYDPARATPKVSVFRKDIFVQVEHRNTATAPVTPGSRTLHPLNRKPVG